tara:strand:+ start:1045 stop:2346 length:1302 start_codon:yes stop_codon:yes gene_type:complete
METLSNKKIKIAIVGLGYVGLPLALEFSKKYPTFGYDLNEKRINELINNYDRTSEVSDQELLEKNNLVITNQIEDISNCNFYIITVPTPVTDKKLPDLGPLTLASEMIGQLINKDDVIVYESTVYPYATEEYCVPILEKISGLKYNIDFFCGYSPERINPGDEKHKLSSIVKITSGSNSKISTYIDNVYKSIITAGTYNVSSIAIAESAKIIENIQRDVNIALINELAMLFNKLGLDTNEILEAAGTKWNFIPFRPGLVGGHCIGVDPYYLTYKAQQISFNPEMILAGRKINDNMGKYIAEQTIINISKINMLPKNVTVNIFGLTFKEDCPDLRNSKVPQIIKNLESHNCKIIVTDPLADPKEAKDLYNVKLVDEKKLNKTNVIILAVAHTAFKSKTKKDWLKILHSNSIIIDVKSILDKELFDDTKILHWSL